MIILLEASSPSVQQIFAWLLKFLAGFVDYVGTFFLFLPPFIFPLACLYMIFSIVFFIVGRSS